MVGLGNLVATRQTFQATYICLSKRTIFVGGPCEESQMWGDRSHGLDGFQKAELGGFLGDLGSKQLSHWGLIESEAHRLCLANLAMQVETGL
jgi:hypothetical protein